MGPLYTPKIRFLHPAKPFWPSSLKCATQVAISRPLFDAPRPTFGLCYQTRHERKQSVSKRPKNRPKIFLVDQNRQKTARFENANIRMQLDHVLPILIFKAIYERNTPARNSAADHPFSRYASYRVALTHKRTYSAEHQKAKKEMLMPTDAGTLGMHQY